MPYTIEWTRDAIRTLARLDQNTAKRIIEKIKETRNKPQRYFVRLRGHAEYKLRIGDYRVISLISISRKKITVLAIGHRKNVYKK